MKATLLPPDHFLCPADAPYAAEHALLDDYLSHPKTSNLKAESSKMTKEARLRLLVAALERMAFQKTRKEPQPPLSELVQLLTGRKLPFGENEVSQLLDYAATILRPADPKHVQWEELNSPFPGLVPVLLDYLDQASHQKPLSQSQLKHLGRLHEAIQPMEHWGGYAKTLRRIESLLRQTPRGLPDDGEAWAHAIREDIDQMPSQARAAWLALLENAPKASSAKPTAKWKEQADALLGAVGTEEFARRIELWFGLVGLRASARIQPRNESLLRALVWYASLLTGATVCRALANAVEGGLRKLPAGGLYASSIAKACIAALEAMPGLEPIAQLSRLQYRVKSPWGQEEIQKAFLSIVQRSGLAPTEVEELTLPTFGLEAEGHLRQQVGVLTAELRIEGTHTVKLRWLDAQGAVLDQEPKLSQAEAPQAKALKRLASDIEKMLGAQRDRIERLLNSERSWPFAQWRQRYVDHPLVAELSRRLIWHFHEAKRAASGIWRNGRFVQANGRTIDWLSPKTEVRLWHPLGVEPAAVQAWRKWLEQNQVTQPFKQAHREIYLLTEAEQRTSTYSNRFAAHILRQHQLKALCDQRGWHYEFLGNWDSSDQAGNATFDLPQWGLRAQFHTEYAGEEFADSGAALHVATDQVRFSSPDESAVPLTSVPALAFSEVMREVDLFVSVSSIAADPAWVDRGEGQHREYWQQWSFGDLTATAETRRDVLARLLPRLKIAAQCTLNGKFLVVRGAWRTYKIHLGSANIRMEPNDEYLCIVPDRSGTAGSQNSKLFLPFEGDNILSIILSKAFLLAGDTAIKDETILRQIRK